MRPIDADLLQERVHDIFQNVRGHRMVMDIVKQTESVISELIAEQETLDHKPKKKTGRWVRTEVCGVKAVECSSCRIPEIYSLGAIYKYCPHCGAEMEVGAGYYENI